jgi:hypothetical protein
MSNHTRRETVTSRATFGLETTNASLAGLDFDSSGNPQILNASGVAVAEWDSVQGVPQMCELSITGASGSTGVFASLANPFGYDVIIIRAILRITTQSGVASTLDIGVGANATTSNDGLFDGLSGASTGLFDNLIAAHAGTNGLPSQVWATTGFLNVAEASGNVNALVAKLEVVVVRA